MSKDVNGQGIFLKQFLVVDIHWYPGRYALLTTFERRDRKGPLKSSPENDNLRDSISKSCGMYTIEMQITQNIPRCNKHQDLFQALTVSRATSGNYPKKQ